MLSAAVPPALVEGSVPGVDNVAFGALREAVYCSPLLGPENADEVEAIAARLLHAPAAEIERFASSTILEAEERELLGKALGLPDAVFTQADDKDGLEMIELVRRLSEVEP